LAWEWDFRQNGEGKMSDEKESIDIKLIKVKNPLFVGEIAGPIKDFNERLKIPTITYETLYSYFCNTVQYGGDHAEFWIAYTDVVENGISTYLPLAFAHWFVKGLPHRGVVYCDFIYSWNRMREPVSKLIDEFIIFGDKNRAPYYEGEAINDVVYRVFRKSAYKKGLELNKTNLTNFIGRKKHG
jgi:hypothetical protein